MPMMAFIGVRISWLMLARNSPFATVACSARSRATSSSLTSCERRSAFCCSASWAARRVRHVARDGVDRAPDRCNGADFHSSRL